jgi:hypothetical protein
MRIVTKFAIAFACVVGVMAFAASASVGPDRSLLFEGGRELGAATMLERDMATPEGVLFASSDSRDRRFFDQRRPFGRPNFGRGRPFFVPPRPIVVPFFFDDFDDFEDFFDERRFFDDRKRFDRDRRNRRD